MTDGVDATMEAVQSRGADAFGYSRATESKRAQLRNGHDPMLAACDLGQPNIARGELFWHIQHKSPRTADLPHESRPHRHLKG